MTSVLAILTSGSTLALIGLVAWLVYKGFAAKDSQLADRTARLTAEEQCDAMTADRDREHTTRVAAESQNADLTQRLADADAHVADLSAKLARAVVARAKAPVSQDGADAVNDELSTPLLSTSPRDGLEKP